MNKKVKIIAIMLGIIILISSIVGGVVFAQDSDSSSDTSTTTTTIVSRQDTFLSALAAKLNISIDQLKTYIKEAQNETQSQYMRDKIDALVAAGKITQDEADQYLEWWNSKPDFASNSDFGFRFGSGCRMGITGNREWPDRGFHLPKSNSTNDSNN